MFERSSGILLHISSLSGKDGIGTFGKEAYEFVDFLKKHNLNLNNLVVKIPMSLEGLKAVKILKEKNIKLDDFLNARYF